MTPNEAVPLPGQGDAESRARRLAELHRQASVLAHDFNNLLAVIVGATEKLSADLAPGAEQRLAEVALRAAERGAELLGRMLAASADGPSGAGPLDCAQAIQDVLVLAHHAVPEAIEIWSSTPSEPLSCVADSGGLEGALINLCLNAANAMPQGGVLRIDARSVDLAADAARPLGLDPGAYVAFMVRDTGCGMSQAVLAKATEPLFTTRQDTGGTGLGLPSVCDFAKSAGGALTLASREGQGTAAMLYLPRYKGEGAGAAHSAIAA